MAPRNSYGEQKTSNLIYCYFFRSERGAYRYSSRQQHVRFLRNIRRIVHLLHILPQPSSCFHHGSPWHFLWFSYRNHRLFLHYWYLYSTDLQYDPTRVQCCWRTPYRNTVEWSDLVSKILVLGAGKGNMRNERRRKREGENGGRVDINIITMTYAEHTSAETCTTSPLQPSQPPQYGCPLASAAQLSLRPRGTPIASYCFTWMTLPRTIPSSLIRHQRVEEVKSIAKVSKSARFPAFLSLLIIFVQLLKESPALFWKFPEIFCIMDIFEIRTMRPLSLCMMSLTRPTLFIWETLLFRLIVYNPSQNFDDTWKY